MPFTLKKSFVRQHLPTFEVDVAAHAHEMKDWLAREKRVAEDAANPNIPEMNRWAPCPRPEAPNGYVASSVNERGDAEYEIENDDPSPEDLLPVKKAALVGKLRAAEQAAHEASYPLNKRPLLTIRVNDVRSAETRKKEEISASVTAKTMKAFEDHAAKLEAAMKEDEEAAPGILRKAASVIGIAQIPPTKASQIVPPVVESVDVEAVVVSERPIEDADALQTAERVAAKDESISRRVAEALHDIEDLTVDTVDSYTLPDLNK